MWMPFPMAVFYWMKLRQPVGIKDSVQAVICTWYGFCCSRKEKYKFLWKIRDQTLNFETSYIYWFILCRNCMTLFWKTSTWGFLWVFVPNTDAILHVEIIECFWLCCTHSPDYGFFKLQIRIQTHTRGFYIPKLRKKISVERKSPFLTTKYFIFLLGPHEI